MLDFKLNADPQHPQIDRWLGMSFRDRAEKYVTVDLSPTGQKPQPELQITKKCPYRAPKALKRLKMLRMRCARYFAEVQQTTVSSYSSGSSSASSTVGQFLNCEVFYIS